MATETDSCGSPAPDPPSLDDEATYWVPHPLSSVNLQQRPRLDICPTHNHTRCKLTVQESCALYYSKLVNSREANFANFIINFVGSNFTSKQTADVILPQHWVWTYYTPNGFFPYLKWPHDFQILSVGMLRFKTLPVNVDKIILDVSVPDNCSLILGSLETTCQLGDAFKDMTQNYMFSDRHRAYGYSYWCYSKEVPKIKRTWAYSLARHLGSPVEFSRYNCCRTSTDLYNSSQLDVRCLDQVPRLFQISLIPYIAALLAFAYFPVPLFSLFGQRMTRMHRPEDFVFSPMSSTHALLREGQDWVFLDGKPPISFSCLVGGLCGLTDRHPRAVSRCRRAIFLFILPLFVYLQIYLYWSYMYNVVLAYLEHDKPMQFLSLIGGAKRSMKNFAPIFGGPPCLLVIYYVAGIVFVLFPTDLNKIVQYGCNLDSDLGDLSPLFYNEERLIKLSGIHVHKYFGYPKAAAIFRAGIYTLVNGKFWFAVITLQIRRIRGIYRCCTNVLSRSLKALCIFIVALLSPIYIFFCIAELLLCILIYGIPAINCICTMAKGYKSAVRGLLVQDSITEVGQPSQLIGACVIKGFVYFFTACLFVYFTVSISAIVTASFNFLFQVIILCFTAVVVYPLFAFGYAFFTIIILYYIFKQLENFGEGYFELLAMAVEICTALEEDICHARIENDIVVIKKTSGANISKLRIHDQIINLSTDMRNRIKNIRCPQHCRVKHKDNTTGIPRDLFDHLVSVFRPVHVQVFHALLRLTLIAALVTGAVSLVVVKPFGPRAEMGEVLHLIFMIVIGALPKILEIVIDKSNRIVKEDIKRTRMKEVITEYWSHRDGANAAEMYLIN